MTTINFRSNYKTLLNSVLICAILSIPYWVHAQTINFQQATSINDDGATPDQSAKLDVLSTSQGMLIPRMTMDQRDDIVTPATSLLVYQTDQTTGFYFNAGTSVSPNWLPLTSQTSSLAGITDADEDTGISLVEGAEDIIQFEVNGKSHVSIQEENAAVGSVSIGDGTAYQTEYKQDRIEFKGFGTSDVDADIRNQNGQLSIQNYKENFGLTLTGKDLISLRVADEPEAWFQMHNDASFQIGLGTESFGRKSKLDIYHTSSASNPHINLIENDPGKASRLSFRNDHTGLLDWSLAAKLEENAEVFGMYLSGAEKMIYTAVDDQWSFSGSLKVDSDDMLIDPDGVQDGAQIFLKDGSGNDRVKIYAQPTSVVDGGWIAIFNSINNRTIRIQGDDDQRAGRIHIAKSDGTENLKLDADWNGTGMARIVTDEVELNGGSDFAEYFDINEPIEEIEAGLIVSIDINTPGKLIKSNQPYDSKVAGIISGANGIRPGLMMGQDGTIADGAYPIALSGRVYVKANKQSGDILPGDLLTSSSKPGEAMKAIDKNRSFGSIIGKAMTSIDKDGYVLVLVNLQ